MSQIRLTFAEDYNSIRLVHTRNIKYRSSCELQILVSALDNRGWNSRLQISLITRWRYFIALRLWRWWTCLAQHSSAIMMLHVTGICRRITVYNLSTRTVILSEQPTVTEAQPNHILKGNKTNVKQICVCGSTNWYIAKITACPQTPESSQRKSGRWCWSVGVFKDLEQ